MPFLKDEPHPPRKSDVGAWRSVMCVSLVDQVVERMIYARLIAALKSEFPNSDALLGMSFTDEATQTFFDKVRKDMGTDFVTTDVSGWERTLGAEYVYEAAESCIRSAEDPTPFWDNAVRNHTYGLVRPVFIVPKGGTYTLLTRVKEGGMLSGSYVTSLFNTLARLDASRQAGSIRAKAAGDDAAEKFPPGYDFVEAYRLLGFKIRLSDYHTADDFEFCAHRYRKGLADKCPLTSWLKLLLRYNLLVRVDPEQYYAALHETRHNSEKDSLHAIFEALYAASNATDSEAELGQNNVRTNIEKSNDAKPKELNPECASAQEEDDVFCETEAELWSSL